MLNSTKTWQERFKLKLYNVYATVFQLSKYDNQQLKEKADVMVQFISDLRKKDKEELIRIINNSYWANKDSEDYQRKLGLINKLKQYYETNTK